MRDGAFVYDVYDVYSKTSKIGTVPYNYSSELERKSSQIVNFFNSKSNFCL